jgi:hypothetical protein
VSSGGAAVAVVAAQLQGHGSDAAAGSWRWRDHGRRSGQNQRGRTTAARVGEAAHGGR